MQQKETLSAYIDGHNVNGEFTDTLCKSAELQQQWRNYHTIRSVMRGEEQILGNNFSAKMASLLENETIEKASLVKEEPKGMLIKLQRWSTPLMQAGIAASVCLIAVLGVNFFQNGNETAQIEKPALQTLPFSNSVEQVSYNAPAKERPTEAQMEYQQNRINALLQNYELQRRTSVNKVTLSEQEKSKGQTSTVEPSQSQLTTP